jgi:DNA-binding NarL/FixJ family response regulator
VSATASQRQNASDNLLHLSVAIIAADKVTMLGLAALLQKEPRFKLTGNTTRDCKQVVDAIGRQKPDIVLLDLSIARPQQALECCRNIREASPTTQLVAFTNLEEPGIVDRATNAGVLGVVSRAGDPRELVRAVLFAGRGQPYVCSLLRQAPESPELSNRQEHILGLLAEGLDTQDIAERLGVSPETVKSHVKVILQKLSARGRAHAVAIGMRRALIS